MKEPSELAQDMYHLLAELNSPVIPEGVTEMDVARFQNNTMAKTERHEFERIMRQNPGFEAEIEARRQLVETLFSKESLERYEEKIFAALGLERESVAAPPPEPALTIWEAIQLHAERFRAQAKAVLNELVPLTFYPQNTGALADEVNFDFGNDVDVRLFCNGTPDPEQQRVNILVEISDPSLKEKKCRLTWGVDGGTEAVPLHRHSDRAKKVTAEFLLDHDAASAALKTGFMIEPVDA